MSSFLETPIEYLKGVGPQRAELLKKEAGICTFQHLLDYFPFRYIDRTMVNLLSEVTGEEQFIQLKGKLLNIQELGAARNKRLSVVFDDGSGTIELVWFKGVKWIKPTLKVGVEYIVFGRPSKFNGKINMAHPELEELKSGKSSGKSQLQPVYPSGEKLSNKGLNTKGIEKLTKILIPQIYDKIPETLSSEIINDLKLMTREQAFVNVHMPKNQEMAKRAQFRLKFEELFYLQLQLLMQKLITKRKVKGFSFSEVGDFFSSFYNNNLKFELTNAQKRVVKEIRRDIGSGQHMNRLLQGDVGSGKTLVGLLSMLITIDNGYQAALMAPTEILANQHFVTISSFLDGLGVKIGLLTGSTKTSERKVLHEKLESGELNILVGTHALLEDKVRFQNLGMVIIDEQHRFGVAQRARLLNKNTTPPHVLVMTATPIPRTLAMTFYGDLDVSVIDELPPGRKQVKTMHRFDGSRLKIFSFMKQQIEEGRQIYIVYPLIEESEKMDYKDLMDGYESIVRSFPLPEYKVSIVHGKMKPADKDYEMQQFSEGKTQIMVATTVIEVGVDVPNASVMIIESAEKFGLSQLHQLRGRVGRGADQSYCILISSFKLSSDAKTRLETMVRTTDGFEIAEADLKLRGPGDIMGTQQSGILDLKIADLIKDNQILSHARNVAIDVLDKDPTLRGKNNLIIRQRLSELIRGKVNWSRIA